MSKPANPGESLSARAPEEQLEYFAQRLRNRIYRGAQSVPRLRARLDELGLRFSDDEFLILAALETPARVQEFLNTEIYYNYDHNFPGQTETCRSPRGVLRTGTAHCFEGALFAYTVNFLHGHAPQMILLEASEDSDHNLIVYQGAQTKLFGCNAHSGYANLDGRPAAYATVRALVESYIPFYYSDYTLDPTDLTLVGYSEPFDLAARYGVAWMDSQNELWDIYATYIDDTVRFHDVFGDSDETHLYPLLAALQNGWIKIDAEGRAHVSVSDLPPEAQRLWDQFWRVYDEKDPRPRGEAMEMTKRFFEAMRLSPLDLREYVVELEKNLARGYRVEQLFPPPTPSPVSDGGG